MKIETASSFLRLAGDCAYSHHEWWNGTGYHGMRGEEIPVAGRLMALADVYDALTSKRVYKPPFSHERTLEMLTVGNGRTAPEQFDPAVLGAFIELQDTFKQVSNAYRDEDAQSPPVQESPVGRTPAPEENGEPHG